MDIRKHSRPAEVSGLGGGQAVALTGPRSHFDETEFRRFMKRNQKKDNIIKGSLQSIHVFEEFLKESGRDSGTPSKHDLDAFASTIGDVSRIKNLMHALRYYYEFMQNKPMADKSTEIRARFLQKKAFKLKDLVGVKPIAVSRLAQYGIRDANQMVKAGQTESDRRRLQEETGLPLETILELVKMSDLTRIFGLKAIRARLYHDSGVDTVDKMARIDPLELIRVTSEFIRRTRFQGIPPTPKEAQFTVRAARDLPLLVEY